MSDDGTGASPDPQAFAMGVVRGVPGANVFGLGVLDLRGLTSEELKALQSVRSTGVILIDSAQRSALVHVTLENVGAVVEIAPTERLLLQPLMEVSTPALKAMAPGQEFTLVGMLQFAPDVPPALVAEKFAALRLIGVLIAPAGVHGALFGRLDHTGVAVTLPEGGGPLVRAVGDTRLTPGYLSRFAPGSVYLNMGRTVLTPDVSEDALGRAIATYFNLGLTTGPVPLLELLQSRCPINAGAFVPEP